MTKMTFAFMVMAGLVACNDNEEIERPISAQFEGNVAISEGAGVSKIALLYDRPAIREGFAVVEVSSSFNEDFQLDHEVIDGFITLEINEDDTAAFIIVTPINNQILDGNKTLTFTLNDLSDGFFSGELDEMVVTILDDESPAVVNFAEGSVEVKENETQGRQIIIHLETPAPGMGKITLQFDQSLENIISSDLVIVNGKAEIEIPFGATQATFIIAGVNNNELNGHKTLRLVISQVNGALQAGNLQSMNLTVMDDELVGKPKSYETTGGGWFYSRTYEYDELGRVKKIHWEQRTPGRLFGTETYYYNENGSLERINNYEGNDDYYFYENGRLIKSENIQYGVIKSYSLYDYDDAGYLGGMASYHLQPGGEFKNSLVFVYLNHTDGNIFKQLTYVPVEGEFELISTRTYQNYHDKANPFPMFEVIPTITSQPKLPGAYQVEENGSDLFYNFTFIFNTDELPTSKQVSGSGNETTFYYYY